MPKSQCCACSACEIAVLLTLVTGHRAQERGQKFNQINGIVLAMQNNKAEGQWVHNCEAPDVDDDTYK